MDTLTTARKSALSVGWGIIGASRVAQRFMIDAIRYQPHLPEASQIVPSWIVGLYSRNPSRGRTFAADLHLAQVYESLDALLHRSEVQCVYVSSHPRYQYEMVRAALEAGKHVLCETPLSLSLEDAHHLHDLAVQQDLLLAVNYALRFHPALTLAAELIRNYEIGNVLGIRISNTDPLPVGLQSWRLEEDGGGVIFDRTLHDIDLVRWLLADEISQVVGMAGKPFLGEAVEEDVLTSMQMRRSGVSVQLHDSFIMLHQHSTLEVYGTGGTLIVYRWWNEWQNSELLLVRNDEVERVPPEQANPYQRLVAAFNGIVRKGRQSRRISTNLATGDDGVRNLRTALALRYSLQHGQSIRLE
jgi:1,5-anhydro-D-fructose reductase (1,5-anhydro-D-mannitol-forming)